MNYIESNTGETNMKSELLEFEGLRTGGQYVQPSARQWEYWSWDFAHLDAPNTIPAGAHKAYDDSTRKHGSAIAFRLEW